MQWREVFHPKVARFLWSWSWTNFHGQRPKDRKAFTALCTVLRRAKFGTVHFRKLDNNLLKWPAHTLVGVCILERGRVRERERERERDEGVLVQRINKNIVGMPNVHTYIPMYTYVHTYFHICTVWLHLQKDWREKDNSHIRTYLSTYYIIIIRYLIKFSPAFSVWMLGSQKSVKWPDWLIRNCFFLKFFLRKFLS
jgi:hypothetical protein